MAIELRPSINTTQSSKEYIPKPGDILQGEGVVYQGYGPKAPYAIDRVMIVIDGLDSDGNVDYRMIGKNPASPEKAVQQWKYRVGQQAFEAGKLDFYYLRLITAARGI